MKFSIYDKALLRLRLRASHACSWPDVFYQSIPERLRRFVWLFFRSYLPVFHLVVPARGFCYPVFRLIAPVPGYGPPGRGFFEIVFHSTGFVPYFGPLALHSFSPGFDFVSPGRGFFEIVSHLTVLVPYFELPGLRSFSHGFDSPGPLWPAPGLFLPGFDRACRPADLI